MDKQSIRREMALRKSLLSSEQIEAASATLAARLYETSYYNRAKSVYAYMSFNQEIHTSSIIERAWADGKRVAIPKIIDRQMLFIWLDSWMGLQKNTYGIDEPTADGPVADDESALILVPGLAFDLSGQRIGYGGGYYDRFLARERQHPLISLCYDFQIVTNLPAEIHDIPVDIVLRAPPVPPRR